MVLLARIMRLLLLRSNRLRFYAELGTGYLVRMCFILSLGENMTGSFDHRL